MILEQGLKEMRIATSGYLGEKHSRKRKEFETEGGVVCLRTMREWSDQEERPGEEPTEVVAGQP